MSDARPQEAPRLLRDQLWAVFAGGAVIGLLGGLIGLGGAEFRLPLLIAVFGFVAFSAAPSCRLMRYFRTCRSC